MNIIAICGEFLTQERPIGTFRVSYEVVRYIDQLINVDNQVELIIPENAVHDIELKKIKKIFLPNKRLRRFWMDFKYVSYVKRNNRIPLIISGHGPLTYPSYFYIHDINYLDHPENFAGLKRKLIRMDRIIENKLAVRKAKHIFTISKFQKERIIKHYKLSDSKVDVIYHGWEHIEHIKEDNSIFLRHPRIRKGEYFFTLGTVIEYKNFKWIVSFAKNNQQFQFVVAGNIYEKNIKELKEMDNIILLDYITDGEMKALMKGCRAFIYPSLYEGFGLPPLEAIACGAIPIVSTAACLPEIYRNNAYFIDPYNMETSYDDIFSQTPDSPDELLKIYSWEKTADQLLSIIKKSER